MNATINKISAAFFLAPALRERRTGGKGLIYIRVTLTIFIVGAFHYAGYG